VSEDVREKHTSVSGCQGLTEPARTAAKSAKKDRLAAALRENLKRRKAQISARRQVSARQDEPASE
jgi:hypothetical protein